MYAVGTPAWQAPDEPAHYNYVAHVAERGRLPVLQVGDYPAAYLEQLKAERFPPELAIEPVRYESHQPPLYYLAASLPYRLAQGMAQTQVLLAVRVFSLLLGLVLLLVVYRLIDTLYPAQPVLALGTMVFLATLPMHLTMTATVNNDVLAELVLTFVVWKLILTGPADWTRRRAFGFGALLGLALLTKLQAYVALPLVFYALLRVAWPPAARERLSLGVAVGRGVIMLGTAAVIASPWLVRNITLYGSGDILALAQHERVVAGQLTTAAFVAERGWGGALQHFFVTTFNSFWGQFGWMGVPMPQRVYLALAVVSALVLVGLVAYGLRLSRAWAGLARRRRRGLCLLVLWFLLTLGGYLWYNLFNYVQPQARYLFPAMTPIALGFVLGLRELLYRIPRVALVLLGAALVLALLLGFVRGDLPGYTLALLFAAGVAVAFGARLERVQPGLALVLFYSGMAALAVLALNLYVIPHLAP
jgi:4-amino-4-deoxy-L-arabinose transferase-like glycosyltransferase